ncbi:MAG: DUF971 domain-containing protein [Acidimicrobiales bacterium]
MDGRTQPTDVEVRKGAGVTITFADGHVAEFNLTDLRLGCPCATCRGLRDRGEDVWPRPGSPTPLGIDDAQFHGAWGLRFTWNDGHGTGIYPFDALRRWSEGKAPFRADSGLGGAQPPGEGDQSPVEDETT